MKTLLLCLLIISLYFNYHLFETNRMNCKISDTLELALDKKNEELSHTKTLLQKERESKIEEKVEVPVGKVEEKVEEEVNIEEYKEEVRKKYQDQIAEVRGYMENSTDPIQKEKYRGRIEWITREMNWELSKIK